MCVCQIAWGGGAHRDNGRTSLLHCGEKLALKPLLRKHIERFLAIDGDMPHVLHRGRVRETRGRRGGVGAWG